MTSAPRLARRPSRRTMRAKAKPVRDDKTRSFRGAHLEGAPLQNTIGTHPQLLLRTCLLCGHKILHHRLAHQVGWQQALRQDEVVELLLVELWTQRFLRILAQVDQLGESIEVAVRLSGCAIGKAFDLLLGKGMRQHYILLQHAEGIRWRDFASL